MQFFNITKGKNNKKSDGTLDAILQRIKNLFTKGKEKSNIYRVIIFECPPEGTVAFTAWTNDTMYDIEKLKDQIPGLRVDDKVVIGNIPLSISNIEGIESTDA